MATAVSADTLEQREYNGEGRAYPPLELDGDVVPGVLRQAEPYVAPPSLRDAVNMALYLRRPLLLEGEPGTGKTRLAYSVAYELGYPIKEIYIRSTNRAQDLLWTFDAVRRLYDIQEFVASGRPAAAIANEHYVKLGTLGEAIELSMYNIPSVVLIDEIDKADLDFPERPLTCARPPVVPG